MAIQSSPISLVRVLTNHFKQAFVNSGFLYIFCVCNSEDKRFIVVLSLAELVSTGNVVSRIAKISVKTLRHFFQCPHKKASPVLISLSDSWPYPISHYPNPCKSSSLSEPGCPLSGGNVLLCSRP